MLLLVSLVNNSLNRLGGFTPVIDSTGKITGYKTKVGADTVFPFSSGFENIISNSITTKTSWTININLPDDVSEGLLVISTGSSSPHDAKYCHVGVTINPPDKCELTTIFSKELIFHPDKYTGGTLNIVKVTNLIKNNTLNAVVSPSQNISAFYAFLY